MNGPPSDGAGTIPADPYVELALLGALLLEPPMMDEVEFLRPEHFYSGVHRRAYQRMREVWAAGEPLDTFLICGNDAELRLVLLDAQSACPSGLLAPQYADRLLQLAEKRRFVGVAQDLAAMALNGSAPHEIAVWLQDELGKTRESHGGNPFDRWDAQLITAAEMAQAGPLKREYLVEDLLRTGSLSIFYGKPGEFKSGLLMDLAQCVAAGRPWLEPLPVAGNDQKPLSVRQGRVLWLNYDQAHEDVIERFGALQRAYKVGGENVFAISQSEPHAALRDERQARKLGRWMREREFVLAIIDSLLDVRGDRKLVEEEIGDVLRLWRIVTQESGAAVGLISHPTKGAGDLFGSTFLVAKLDHLYHIKRAGDTAVIESEKQRAFGITSKLQARWSYAHFDGTRTLKEARFWGDNSRSTTRANRTTGDLVRDALMRMPGRAMVVNELHSSINAERKPDELITREAVRKAADRLADTERNIEKIQMQGENAYRYGPPITT